METVKNSLVAIGKYVFGLAVFLLLVQAVVHGWPYALVAVLMLGPLGFLATIILTFFVGFIVVSEIAGVKDGEGKGMFEAFLPMIMTAIAIVGIISLLSKHVIIH